MGDFEAFVGYRCWPPAELDGPGGHQDARRRLRGLSALGRLDRQHRSHHENWAFVVNLAAGLRYLAPTFDHASSLGAHHEDATRARRLESNDPAFRVEGYVEKARSALYAKAGAAQPMTAARRLPRLVRARVLRFMAATT